MKRPATIDGSAVIVRRAPGSQRPVGTVGTGGLVTVHGKLNASDGFNTPGERVEFRGGESPHKHLAGRLSCDGAMARDCDRAASD